jgi:hypothetical protein
MMNDMGDEWVLVDGIWYRHDRWMFPSCWGEIIHRLQEICVPFCKKLGP